MERRLVRTEVYAYVAVGQTLPQVNHIALIGQRHGLALGHGPAYALHELVEVGVHLVDPALGLALLHGLGVDFGHHGHHSGYIAGLGLRAAHAAEAGRHEEHPPEAAVSRAAPRGVEHRDGSAVDYALRAYIHVGAGRHLAVLTHTQRVEALPVVGLAVIGHYHAVGHHHTRRLAVRGEEAQRMARVHYERLLVAHLAEIFHRQAVLRPVLEHRPVAAVGYQLVGMLCHGGVEVVLYHHHDGGCLARPSRILVHRTGVHLVVGTIAVHVDAPVGAQLMGKLRRQLSMKLGREVTQRVLQR